MRGMYASRHPITMIRTLAQFPSVSARPNVTRTAPSHGEPGSAAEGSQIAAPTAPSIDTRVTASARSETLVAWSAILSRGPEGVYPVPAATTIQAHQTAAISHGLMAEKYPRSPAWVGALVGHR